jgi:hypothetical protein
MLNRIVPILLGSLTIIACSDGARLPEGEALESATPLEAQRSFTDARWYFDDPERIDAWYALTAALRDDFDEICGDTFCEGDYSNYESLGVRCSVERSSGIVGSCVWVFAASIAEIVPETGQIRVSARHWRCRAPLARRTTATELLETLGAAGSAPLFAPLPRTTASLYDGLIDCL